MKNIVKSITTICILVISLSCKNTPYSQTEQFSNSGKVFSYVDYADEMIAEGYIRDSLEMEGRNSLNKMDNK